MNEALRRPLGNYLQYGCGMSSPTAWLNFDASPRLWLQRLPLIGPIFRRGAYVFPRNVRYGNIAVGIAIKDNSMDGVYASHILEHLSLQDFRSALRNTLNMLKPGGIFRLIVPDLEELVGYYIARVNRADPESAHYLMRTTQLAMEHRNRGLKSLVTGIFGNEKHLWMWDANTLVAELAAAGFVNIRRCAFGDSDDRNFDLVEEESRFVGCCAMEARKP